jgi:hypothetical protein
VAGSSSTKKAAKLAQKGKGRKVRFQGGTVFPAVVAAVLILGLATIAYARQTLEPADESPPTIQDHWHAAYGFYLCDQWYQLAGNLEDPSEFGYSQFNRTGIHSHDDGVMHWHPFTSVSVGENAVLGVFLETYGVTLTNDTLTFPAGNVLGPSDEYVEGETKCNGEDAELSVVAWDSYSDSQGDGKRYIANMDRIHIDNDGMVFGIFFTPRNTDQPMPPWAQDLPTLGAADVNQARPDATLAPGDTSPLTSDPTSSGSSSGDTSSSDTGSSPATTVASTSPPTTTG